MQEIQNPKGKIYYYLGSFLVAIAAVLIFSFFTMELFFGNNEHTYLLVLSAIAFIILIAFIIIPYMLIKSGKETQLEYIIISSLRFVVSTIMLGYAFTKLRNGHMYLSYYALDTKLNDLDDFNTVWSFYGRFSSLQVLIGLFELVPAVLLLFRRTAFIGAVVMLPVIANVVVLNTFYQIGMVTLPLSSMLLIFNLYILFSYKKAILDLFQRLKEDYRPATLKPFFRKLISVIKFLPLCFFGALILLKVVFPNKNKNLLRGGYELTDFKINGLRVSLDTLTVDGYKKIYFEKRKVQNSLVNKNGAQGASISFYSKDSIKISYRNGALDVYVPEDTTGIFRGSYQIVNDSVFILKGKQKQKYIEATYKKLPLKEYDYWWE